jgi:hypothetical protein
MKEGPVMSQSITEVEKILKYSYDSVHKLDSMNKERAQLVFKAIVAKLG